MGAEREFEGTSILLSAYAFEPHRGSEPGLGWLWAKEASDLGFSVTVLTSGARHKAAIESGMNGKTVPFRIEYVDFPWLFRGTSPYFQHLHYVVWLLLAGLRSARLRSSGERYAFCHQVTWASVRYPTFLVKNGPLLLGPVGGAERPAEGLMRKFSLSDRAKEWLRIVSVGLPKWLGLSRLWLGRVDLIGLTSADNMWVIPSAYHHKTFVSPTIALHDFPLAQQPRQIGVESPIRILFIGRFVAWKGLHLFMATINTLRNRGFKFSCTLVGDGPLKTRIVQQINEFGLNELVQIIDWVPRNSTIDIYDSHDILLFPSLHDSGGMVVLEAMARGLPVITLRAGGPGDIVSSDAGYLCDTNVGFDVAIQRLADAVEVLSDPEHYHRASSKALARGQDFESGRVVRRIYRLFMDRIQSEEMRIKQ